jgi:hypothetical protein
MRLLAEQIRLADPLDFLRRQVDRLSMKTR